MAEVKTLNTRIVLRNDTLENWNNSDKALLKGEAALALRTDGKYEIRFGAQDSLSSWSQLSSKGQLVIPAKNVEFLTYQEYQLSSLAKSSGEQSKFQLWGKKSDTNEWVSIGDAITVPEVDFGPVNAKIEYLSNEVSTITETTLPNLKSELSNTLSTYTDTKVSDLNTSLVGIINTVSGETLVSAAATAQTKADDALASAKAYSNTISTALSTDYQAKVDDIYSKIKDGIHFVGKVAALSVDATGGYYQKTEGGDKVYANNGDLVIKDNIEYVYSSSDKEWVQLGDEGTWASKAYVDDATATAKSEAIADTKNTVVTSVDVNIDDCADGTNTGDVQIIKKFIALDADNATLSTWEYTAYSWNGTAWSAMDGNYNADNVYFNYDIIKAGSWGGSNTVGNISHTANKVEKITSTGKTLSEVMDMIFKGDEGFPTKAEINKPYASISFTNGGSYEYGTTVTPTFRVTISPRTYTYGSNSNTENNSTTGISALNWTIDYTKYDGTAGTQLTGAWNKQITGDTTADKSIDSIVLTSTYTAKNLTATVSWNPAPDGTYIPRSNLERVLSSTTELTTYRTAAGTASTSTRGGSDFTVKYPRYYKFTSTVESIPTTFSASSYSGWTRDYSNKTTFTATAEWFQLFYLEPADQGHTSWTGKDSNNITLKVSNPASNVTMTYINGDTGSYKLFVVTNAAKYSATTCSMTMA